MNSFDCGRLARFVVTAGILAATSPLAAQVAVDPGLTAYEPRDVTAPAGAGYVLPDGSAQIVGTEVMTKLIESLDARFIATHPGTRFTLKLKGTSAAMPALTHGITAFAPMGRQVTWVEDVPYSKIVDAPPLEIRIAHGSVSDRKKANVLALFVNKANPVDHLTAEQVSRIFGAGHMKGDLTVWNQVGLKGELGKQPIHAYGPTDDGGFGLYMKDAYLKGMTFRGGYERMPDSAQIVGRIGEDAAGIGYAAISFLTPEVKVVAVAPNDGAEPSRGSADDVSAGRYPFDRYVYFYVRRLPGQPVDPFVKEYLRLVLSKEGQQIVAGEENGYVPLNAREAAQELAKLD
jgi:phosphate transport system substrate-binding protein